VNGQRWIGIALLSATLPIAGASPGPAAEASPRRAAPDFRLESLDGRMVKLSDFRGKAVLLSFWATWCAPCRVEIPWLVELDRKYRSRGLEIVGIAIDASSKDEVARYAKERNIAYTMLLGTSAVADAYGGVKLLPQTFFVSRQGEIVKSTTGVGGRGELERDVQGLLDRQATAAVNDLPHPGGDKLRPYPDPRPIVTPAPRSLELPRPSPSTTIGSAPPG
jgi:cytochrome c biogenesis protein CcmG/thiol:disulfide interchange protein DsbE